MPPTPTHANVASPCYRPPTVADRLALIAQFSPPLSSVAHPSLSKARPHRLPLAWVATSPSARLAAEQRFAWVVLPSDDTGHAVTADATAARLTGERRWSAFGSRLANAVTELRALQTALGTGDGEKGHEASGARHGLLGAGRNRLLSWMQRIPERLADVDHEASPASSRSVPPSSGAGIAHAGVAADTTETGKASLSWRVHDAQAARCCGVHVGGLTVVLVSGLHVLDAIDGAGQEGAPDTGRTSTCVPSCGAPAPSCRGTGADAEDVVLFPSTTSCGGAVGALLCVPPNAASCAPVWRRGHPSRTKRSPLFREGAVLHGDDGGAEDEAAHDPRTATSVHVVQQFATLRRLLHPEVRAATAPETADARSTVWYRQVFVDSAETVSAVLCGVSQWWLQRPVALHELPTTMFRLPRNELAYGSVEAGSAGPALGDLLPPPQLHLKFLSDPFPNLWWPCRVISVVRDRWSAGARLLAGARRWLLFLWQAQWNSFQHSTPSTSLQSVKLDNTGPPDPEKSRVARRTNPDFLLSKFFELGQTYGMHQLAALDVAHTGIHGEHLLACAIGSVTAAALAPHTGDAWPLGSLRALDLTGCVQLHFRQRGERRAIADMLDSFHACVLQRFVTANAEGCCSPLASADVLLSVSLKEEASRPWRSAAGVALALFTHHAYLQWICAAGCDMSNAALHELGQYGLLVEAIAVAHQKIPRQAAIPSCALRALNLTSAAGLEDVNPTAYLTKLEQLLMPFTNVSDAGICRLDGHTFVHDLSAFLELCCKGAAGASLPPIVQAELQQVIESLQRLLGSTNGGSTSKQQTVVADTATKRLPNEGVASLHRKFCSHLYHLDLTSCLGVTSVASLSHQQHLSLLHLSQTRVTKDGLFGGTGARRPPHGKRPPAALPPLRLFVAEMCEHISDLGGLAHLTSLECLIIRSGSLGDDGLQALCSADMQRLTLIDLSYCDRLHHVACLAQLPALETLILDSTDVTPAEVKPLRRLPSLHTLSVRFCTEFAPIGPQRERLEAVVGPFKALQRYVYEDLAGDDELRIVNREN